MKYKNCLCALALPFISTLAYALPSSPLATEYTLTGVETLTDAKYEIAAGGTLNIGLDAGGAGTLNWSFSWASNEQLLFTQNGTMNIGTDATAGVLHFTGMTSGSGAYIQTGNSLGTLNIGKKGEYIIDGYCIPEKYTVWSSMPKNTNLYGKITITPSNACRGYVGIQNLNFYKGASIYATQEICINKNNSAWNIYGSGMSLSKGLYVGSDANFTNTINMLGENVLADVFLLALYNNGCTLNVNVGNYDNVINKLRITTNSTVNLKLPEIKSGNIFSINTIGTYKGDEDIKGAKIAIEYFVNDYIEIIDSMDLELRIENNKLFIVDKNTYVDLIAYGGSKDGAALNGEWSLVDNGNGGYWLNNSAIPEPAAIAALLGALALGFAAYRRRR